MILHYGCSVVKDLLYLGLLIDPMTLNPWSSMMPSFQTTDFFLDYLDTLSETPENVLNSPLALGTLYTNLNKDLLRGFAKYTTPQKVFNVIQVTESMATLQTKAQQVIAKLFSCASSEVRMKVDGQFDTLVLAKNANSVYTFFWFSCELNKSMIGRFETIDDTETVLSSFEGFINAIFFPNTVVNIPLVPSVSPWLDDNWDYSPE